MMDESIPIVMNPANRNGGAPVQQQQQQMPTPSHGAPLKAYVGKVVSAYNFDTNISLTLAVDGILDSGDLTTKHPFMDGQKMVRLSVDYGSELEQYCEQGIWLVVPALNISDPVHQNKPWIDRHTGKEIPVHRFWGPALDLVYAVDPRTIKTNRVDLDRITPDMIPPGAKVTFKQAQPQQQVQQQQQPVAQPVVNNGPKRKSKFRRIMEILLLDADTVVR